VAGETSDLRFTDTHEWVRIKNRHTIVVGISEYFETRLADVTSVELPEPEDQHYEAGDEVCVIEALNSSAIIHAPVSGHIVATNAELLSRPELINLDPFGHGWLFELKPDNLADVFGLTDVDNYEDNLPLNEEE
jgi:glycine cleavage system H protein